MAKIGDSVRYLNTTGGGVITRIEGKMAYVDENGFETPVLLKDIVVVLPAGHEPKHKGASIMFDQKAFDEGKKAQEVKKPEESAEIPVPKPAPGPIVETAHGDTLNIALAFEPTDLKSLGKSKFTAVLVNDSNYFLDFTFLRRADGERGWTIVYKATAAPNELLDLINLAPEELPSYEKICFQAIAYKQDKPFSLQPPINVTRKLDLTKFHKLHCFRPGVYFDNPVIEIMLLKEGLPEKETSISEETLSTLQSHYSVGNNPKENLNLKVDHKAKQSPSGSKSSVEGKNGNQGSHRNHAVSHQSAPSPFKLLPIQEIDLHIGELVDTTAGMEPKDMLELQLETVRKTMQAHEKRKGQKIVFIHGKGEGVLRKAVLDLLKKEYPKAELQDASFREYGFGATIVTIH